MSEFHVGLRRSRWLGWGLAAVWLAGCSLLPGGASPAGVQVATVSSAGQSAGTAPTKAPATATKASAATKASPATSAPAPATAGGPDTGARFGLMGDLTQKVSVKPSEDVEPHPGQFGESLPVGAEVDTDETGRARLLLENGTTVRLAPNTQTVLTDRRQPASGDLLTQLNLLIGKVWVLLPRGANETLTVETPAGVGAVRGSFMSVEYAPGRPNDDSDDVLIITCLEGDCSISNATGTLKLTTGQKAFIQAKGGPIAGPEPMTQADVNDWLDNNPEILILFGITNGQPPESGGPVTIQIPGGGIIFILPTPTSTGAAASPTPTPTPTPIPGGGSTLPTAVPAAGVSWPSAFGARADGLAVVFFGLVLGVVGRGWLKRRR